MGQMTIGILYGCKVPELPEGKRWHGDSEQIDGKWVYQKGLLDAYKAGRGPRPEMCSRLIGFWVAVGVDQLDVPVRLDAVPAATPYKAPHDRAVKAWAKFAAWCEKQGVKLGEPSLWLAQTEVA